MLTLLRISTCFEIDGEIDGVRVKTQYCIFTLTPSIQTLAGRELACQRPGEGIQT